MALNVLEGLNPAQREAVETVQGPLLIVAGPGSGKTRVITHRVAYLAGVCGISPHRILAVTFTNKAANEMKGRLLRLMGPRVERLTVGTFHAFCASVLRRDGKHIGLDPGFIIFDEEDQLEVLKRAMGMVEIDPRQFPPRAVLSTISRAKSLLLGPPDFALQLKSYYEEVVLRAYERYQELLERNQGVDFDDLLLKTVRLLQHAPQVQQRYQRRFVHLLIDEFQDTNVAQYALARLLVGEHRNICVVGDPDQSIYAWRNADIRNILSFQRDFPDAKVVNLAENYRSTQTILAAAKHLISANQQRLKKELWSHREQGQPLLLYEAYTEEEEAQFVVGEVERLVKEEGFRLRDCAVMYRINAKSRAPEEACLRYGMPYKLVGGVRFYQRKEVKDIIAYLRLLQNLHDEVSLTRVINVPPRGIGQRSLDELARWARARDVPLLEALRQVAQDPSEGDGSRPPLVPRVVQAVKGFLQVLDSLAEQAKQVDVVELIDLVVERTGYRQYLLESVERGEERWENIRELRATAQEFRELGPAQGLPRLLERLALVADVDSLDENVEGLTLITLHQAKGLEFPVVFIVGLEEGLLPHARSLDDPGELEEERRLCYVGMTRAQDRLYLVRSFRRGMFGGGGPTTPTTPSRFLAEIPEHLLAAREPVQQRLASWGGWAPAPAPGPASPKLVLKDGDRVRHEKFGEGMVMSCVPSGNDHEVTVVFKGEAGVKRLLLSYAPLEKLT
ncbi:MAG: ATP-dependent helicase [Dehalococcoidia bacterium]